MEVVLHFKERKKSGLPGWPMDGCFRVVPEAADQDIARSTSVRGIEARAFAAYPRRVPSAEAEVLQVPIFVTG
jgi:hypothetical protein